MGDEPGGVGTRVVFENDRVRIWELRLAPGARGDVHRHDLDHVLVSIAGDRMAVEPAPESAGPFRDYLEGDIEPGQVTYVRRGGVETAINVGATEFHEIIVELKD
jgi:hypothetical protein